MRTQNISALPLCSERCPSLLWGMLSVFLMAVPVGAAVKAWVHGGANNNFSANSNWSPSGSPALAAPGDDIVFGSDNSVKPNMNDLNGTSTYYSSVIFTNGGFTIRTATDARLMRVRSGSGITNRAGFSNGDNVIGPHVVMLGSMSIVNENSKSRLIFIPDDRNVEKYTIDGQNNALIFDGVGDFTIGDVDSNLGEMRNIGSLTKQGTGSLDVWGTNRWNGNCDVQAGTLRLSTVNKLQGSIFVKNGATLATTLDHPAETLIAHGLTMGSSETDVTTNTFELGAFGTPATNLISVGDLTINGTVLVNVTGWGLSPGQFALIKYQTLNGDGANFLSNTFPAGVNGHISNNIAAKSIDMVIRGPVVPMQADHFVDSIGVNVHIAIYKGDTNFAVYNYTNTLAAATNLGVRHVRDGFGYWPAGDERNTIINNLAANGIRFQAAIGGCYTWQIADYAVSLLAAANSLDPGALDWIEGVNEPNIFDLFMSPQDVFDLQAALWNQFKADPNQNQLPILLPPIVLGGSGNAYYTNGSDLAGQLAALGIHEYANYGNAHPYPNSWRMPEGLARITEDLALNQTLGRHLPLIVSEVQYPTPTPQNGRGVDEWAAGIYTPRLLLDLNDRGVRNISIYELFDIPGEGDGNFRFAGLYRSDGTSPGAIKPQGTALKNMMRLLADPGPSFQVTNLNFIASGGGALRSKLFQKRNGEYWLALWRPVDVGYWDGAAFVHSYPAAQDVALSFNGYVPSGITTYTDLGSETISTTELNPGPSVTIPEVGAMLKFVRITGTGSTNPSAPVTLISPPYFDGDGNFVVAGTNSSAAAGDSYSLLFSTNLYAPVATWPTNRSGVFGPGGSFTNLVAPDPTGAQRFLIIKTP